MHRKTDILIVGAGPAGLSCAIKCNNLGKDYLLIEKSNRVGGRVGSIKEYGYIFDLGFQVYNTAYSLTNSLLNLDQLELKTFKPGASIYNGKSFDIISDPQRDFSKIFTTLFSNITTFSDKLKILTLKQLLINYSIDNDQTTDLTTNKFLHEYGFSKKIIECFFRPFCSGIFLERQLDTSSKFFKYIFSKFNIGLAALPSKGMQMIPENMFKKIEYSSVLFDTRIKKIHSEKKIELNNGKTITANKIILTGDSCSLVSTKPLKFNSIKTLYFSSDIKPKNGEYIHLFPNSGIINNIAILTSISDQYSESSDHLISVSIFSKNKSEADLIRYVNEKLTEFYGGALSDYRFLKFMDIKRATIYQKSGYFNENNNMISDKIIFAGDHMTNASIEGAVLSGMKAYDKLEMGKY